MEKLTIDNTIIMLKQYFKYLPAIVSVVVLFLMLVNDLYSNNFDPLLAIKYLIVVIITYTITDVLLKIEAEKKIDDISIIFLEKTDDITNLIANPTKHALFTQQIKDSDFEFSKLIRKARKSIFVAGPNLTFLTKKSEKDKMQKIIFDKIEESPNINIQLLFFDRNYTNTCRVMQNSAFSKDFINELNYSTITLYMWMLCAKAEKKDKNLSIFTREMITFSLILIDAEDDNNGFAVVAPIPYNTKGAERPYFVVEHKKQAAAFQFYYTAYKNLVNSMSESLTDTFVDASLILAEESFLDYNKVMEHIAKNKDVCENYCLDLETTIRNAAKPHKYKKIIEHIENHRTCVQMIEIIKNNPEKYEGIRKLMTPY